MCCWNPLQWHLCFTSRWISPQNPPLQHSSKNLSKTPNSTARRISHLMNLGFIRRNTTFCIKKNLVDFLQHSYWFNAAKQNTHFFKIWFFNCTGEERRKWVRRVLRYQDNLYHWAPEFSFLDVGWGVLDYLLLSNTQCVSQCVSLGLILPIYWISWA